VTAREHGRERRLANTRSQRLSLFPPGASAAAHRTVTDLAFPSAAITRLQPTARMPVTAQALDVAASSTQTSSS
jgi:hypothetical protein